MSSGTHKSLAYSRHNFSVLVVCANSNTNNQIRQTLKALGFAQISSAPSHIVGLERARDRKFTHVFYDARSSDMPASEFVEKIIEGDEECTLIAVSGEPRVDDVFGQLSAGSRGFLVVPFTVDSIEEVVVQASEGPPLSEAVLHAPDRNTALVGVVLNNLYRVSVLMRQAREFATASRELERQRQSFHRSVEMAKMFCEGSDDDLLSQLVEACIARANLSSTRLGRTRKKLKQKRGSSGADSEEDSDSAS